MGIFRNKIFQSVVLLLLMVASLGVAYATSGETTGIGKVAANVTATMGAMAKLITAASYVAGMGFAIGAVLKFKAHKDNPTQIPVGTPIALLFVAAALIFMPSLFTVAGQTLFGDEATKAGVSGITAFGTSGSSQ